MNYKVKILVHRENDSIEVFSKINYHLVARTIISRGNSTNIEICLNVNNISNMIANCFQVWLFIRVCDCFGFEFIFIIFI
jgi:hypothetical protein